jgi:hypothetical protein
MISVRRRLELEFVSARRTRIAIGGELDSYLRSEVWIVDQVVLEGPVLLRSYPVTCQARIQLSLDITDIIEGVSLHVAHPPALDGGKEGRVVGDAATGEEKHGCKQNRGESDATHLAFIGRSPTCLEGKAFSP